jgi:hypothetical protein
MEAIALGIAIGAGVVLAIKHGKAGAKRAIGWTARQAGWVSGQVDAAVKQTRRAVREQYERGREENLKKAVDIPPPSSRSHANGTNLANGSAHSEPHA